MKSALLKASLSFVLSLLISSCSNSINEYTASQYYEFGIQAETADDLPLAQRNYSRAYKNAIMGNLGPKSEAYYLYEYARVTGYAGNYQESEKAFIDVLALIKKAEGEADDLRAPALAEYSRLLHDTDQHQKAIPIYEKAVIELELLDIESDDPIGFAILLDDYAESLSAAGFSERATRTANRSARLKANHKNTEPRFQGRRYKTNNF